MSGMFIASIYYWCTDQVSFEAGGVGCLTKVISTVQLLTDLYL